MQTGLLAESAGPLAELETDLPAGLKTALQVPLWAELRPKRGCSRLLPVRFGLVARLAARYASSKGESAAERYISSPVPHKSKTLLGFEFSYIIQWA